MTELLRPVALAVVCLGLCGVSTQAATEIDPARVNQIATWLPARPAASGRPLTDRAAWEALGQKATFASVLHSAEQMAKEPVPAMPDDLFLDFSRTGNRERGQKVLGERENRVTFFTLAECLENKGRFISPLVATIDALSQERTWVYPAHDRQLVNFHGQAKEMDLRATLVAWELGTADYLLGDKLPAATRRQIRQQVEGRVLQPFREMVEGKRPEVFWMRATHNWNAVCLAGITGAALALEDSPAERAWYVAAAEHFSGYFLKGFTPDGYCSEGVGYWNYGFGRFIMLSEMVRQATGGHLDLLANPAALAPARYGTRTEIVSGVYPTIADVHPGSRPEPMYVRFLCERLALPLPADCRVDFQRPAGGLSPTVLFSFLPEPLPPIPHGPLPPESPLRTWFTNGGVLICRGASNAAFGAVLKGGHNAENHNHNDVGSFSVVVGSAMVICDPGAEVYTRRTFSSHRYESKVLSSFGHAVPVVAGQLQHPGAEARAVVLGTEFSEPEDRLSLDLRSAYAVPELKELKRSFRFIRTGSPSLVVEDQVRFSQPESFETALVSWGTWKQVSGSELLLQDKGGAVRVKIESEGKPIKISAESLDEDLPNKKKPLRLGIALREKVAAARVRLTISPE